MKLLLIFCAAGALSGCASAPIENPWDDLTTDTKPAATAIDCGEFPMPSSVDGEDVVYDNAGVNDLEAFRQCSQDNAEILDEHAAQIGQLKTARNSLTEAGQHQRIIADMRLEMLEEQRRDLLWERAQYWIVILAMAAAL